MRPLAIDLFCGLGGWTEALLDLGYYVVGFDIERHVYGEHSYPGQLAASGNSSQLAASGDTSQLAASGENSVIASSAVKATAKGALGTWISLAEFDSNGKCVGFATGCIGQDGLEPDTYYRAAGGKLVAAWEDDR